MSQIILKSNDSESLEQLVISALRAEENEIRTGILKTKNKLSTFEEKYSLSTKVFINTPPSNLKINELDAIEWSGEYETLTRLEKELSRLMGIEICT